MSLVGNDRDLAVALDNGKFDLLHFFDALAIVRRFKNIVFSESRSVHTVVQKTAMLNDQRSVAIQQSRQRLGIEFRERQSDTSTGWLIRHRS